MFRYRSVFEEDGEQGVAHIVEHLAFSATKDYLDHDLVHFLESIGSKFGPCNNAYTSLEETVYEILVPVDRPEILSKALHILAEFSTEVWFSLGQNRSSSDLCVLFSFWDLVVVVMIRRFSNSRGLLSFTQVAVTAFGEFL